MIVFVEFSVQGEVDGTNCTQLLRLESPNLYVGPNPGRVIDRIRKLIRTEFDESRHSDQSLDFDVKVIGNNLNVRFKNTFEFWDLGRVVMASQHILNRVGELESQ
jgi:hypothetical protein